MNICKHPESSLSRCMNFQREAIGYLKKGDDESTRSKARKALRLSLSKDPKYLPSLLTKAAMEIYEDEDVAEGSKTVQYALKLYPENKDLLQMQMDLQAIKHNLGHMVKAGFFPMKYLPECSYRRP